MQLNTVSNVLVVSFYLISALLLVVLIGLVAYALLKLTAIIEAYQSKLDPLLIKAEAVLTSANDTLETISGKAESILGQGEAMTMQVSGRVDQTTSMVQRTVNAPFIGINATIAGVTRGLRTFSQLSATPDSLTADAPVEEAQHGIFSAERAISSPNDVKIWSTPTEALNQKEH
jgi:hypothetical protein